MAVRRLRAKQRGPKCSYCPERAVHRGCGFTKFACAEPLHLSLLTAADQRSSNPYQSDAEWMLGI